MKKTFYFLAVMLLVLCTIVGCKKKTEEGPKILPGEKTLQLTQAPTSWGKIIKGSLGKIIYYDNFQGAFSGRIELKGLTPNHNYLLTLNGKPPHPSNDRLPESYGVERYVDFLQVITTSAGNVDENFSVKLSSGDYNVKFFVKDPDDWKVILYNDFLIFTVR